MITFWFCGDATEWQRLADTRFTFARSTREEESVGIRNKASASSVHNQQPTVIKFPASLKAGRGKAHRGSESGSSKESSSSSSVSASKFSPKFKACRSRSRSRARRARGGRRRQSRFPIPRRPSLSPSTPISSPIPTSPTISWSSRYTAKPSVITPQEKLFYSSCSSIFFFFRRICNKDGRNPSPNNHLVQIRDKGRTRRDRGGTRRPHCSLHRTQRPPQQGLYRQRPKRSSCSSLRSHRHPILRRAGPTRLRSTQQSCRLAHQEGQSCNRRARRASRMEPHYFSGIQKFSAAESANERGEREPHWCPSLGGGYYCLW